jgi:hypothetical protein
MAAFASPKFADPIDSEPVLPTSGMTTAQAQALAFRPGSSEQSEILAPQAPQTRGEEAPGFSPERLTQARVQD